MKGFFCKRGVFIRLLALFLILSMLSVPACVQSPGAVGSETVGGDTAAVSEQNAVPTEEQTEEQTEAPVNSVKIRPVGDVVYPYTDNVRAYLEAGDGADVGDFYNGSADQHSDVTIEWDFDGPDKPQSYIFEYSQNEDFSDGVSVALAKATFRRRMTNLRKSAKYYVRVTAVYENGTASDTVSFETTSLGPRVLNAGGYYNNARDMGGYVTEDGHTVLQDMAFRGSAPDNCIDQNSITLNTTGRKFFNEEVKIKTQIDLRTASENCGRTTPAFESADNYVLISLVSYQGAFYKECAGLYRQFFRIFADENNYPIYFHCAGGADRTGTAAAILLALLGVKREEIIQDFEITSFSRVGIRSKASIIPILDDLSQFNGATLSEKTENYLLSIGLTRKEIYNIKAIMLGLDPDGFTEEKTYELDSRDFRYSTASGGNIVLTLLDEVDIDKVSVAEKEMQFTQSGKKITVSEQSLKSIGKGSHKGSVVTKDGKTLIFNIIVDELDITEDFNVIYRAGGEAGPTYYTYIYMTFPYRIFDGIEYHFHSRPEEFPQVESNILLNGVSLKELNKLSMSAYKFSESPGNSVQRHQVPVTILCQNHTVTLLIHTGWLADYFKGADLTVTIKKEFEFDNKGVHYYITRDKIYENTHKAFKEVTEAE